MSSSGMIPPPNTTTSVAPLARRASMTAGKSVLCAPLMIERPTPSTSSWTAALAIISGVWWRPGVDHLEPRVAQGARDDLRAAVVTVESGLGNQDAGPRVGHVVTDSAPCLLAPGCTPNDRLTRASQRAQPLARYPVSHHESRCAFRSF